MQPGCLAGSCLVPGCRVGYMTFTRVSEEHSTQAAGCAGNLQMDAPKMDACTVGALAPCKEDGGLVATGPIQLTADARDCCEIGAI
jgi:hypothetical protein